MRFDHYIWDFDGTLFDSYPHMTRALVRGLQSMGAAPPPEAVADWIKKSVGRALDHFAEACCLDRAVLAARYEAFEAEEAVVPPIPYAGAARVCSEVCRRGGYNYLYTHRDALAVKHLRRHGMLAHFRATITREDGFPPKPAPDAIRSLLYRFGLAEERTIMVGDRDIDLAAGKNAGIASCLFDPDGYYPDTPADHRVSSMAELEALLL